jgi:hypothetical protein
MPLISIDPSWRARLVVDRRRLMFQAQRIQVKFGRSLSRFGFCPKLVGKVPN